MEVQFQEVATHETDWQPSCVKVALNCTLEAALVPSDASPGGMRLDYGHVVVLDDFVDDATRQELLDFITQPGARATRGAT